MSEPLLVVGASVRAAAFSCLRAGITPIAADCFADVDLQQCCSATRILAYPWGLVDFFHGSPCAPWMYSGGLENYPALVRRLAAIRPLYGNPHKVLREVREPANLARALAAANLPFPRIWDSCVGVPADGSWLRKAFRSAGGSGVAVWHGRSEIEGTARRRCYYQERINGWPCSAVYIATRRHAVMLGITRQLMGTPWAGADGFRYVGSIGPLRPAGGVIDALRKIGIALASAFGLVGLFGIDAVVRDETVWTVEVNPRYTASVEILEWALGIRAVTMHIAACCQEQLPDEPDWQASACFGKAILYAQRSASMPERVSRELAQRAADLAWPPFADIPAPDVPIPARAPVATAFATGQDMHMVEQRLRRRVAMLERLVL